MAPPCVLGVDGGTEGIRAGVFDAEGKALAFASCAYGTKFPRPGWAEQVSVRAQAGRLGAPKIF